MNCKNQRRMTETVMRLFVLPEYGSGSSAEKLTGFAAMSRRSSVAIVSGGLVHRVDVKFLHTTPRQVSNLFGGEIGRNVHPGLCIGLGTCKPGIRNDGHWNRTWPQSA